MGTIDHKVTRVLLGLLLLLGLEGCKRASEYTGVQTRDVDALRKDALAGEDLDAIDLLIVWNSLSNARGWNQNIELSPDLQSRLSKYDGKVQANLDIKGVTVPLMADGSKTIIPRGASFSTTIEGSLSAQISIVSGEVGVINGKIFVADGTEATVNGNEYSYAQGQWIRQEPKQNKQTAEGVGK